MANVAPTKVTAKAKDPDKTAKFVTAIEIATETFEDEIGSLHHETRLKVYKNLIRAYRTALTGVWDLARFADIELILETMKDKEMRELAAMAHRLKAPEPKMHTEVENRKVPTLETIMGPWSPPTQARSCPAQPFANPSATSFQNLAR